MKKIFTLLCATFCATSLFANVVTGTCGDNLQWAYDTDTKALTITGSGDMWNYGIEEYPNPWTQVAGEITSVSLPDGLTSIGSSAFYNCSSLTSITIPNSVTSIGNDAFYDCSSLTSVTIGNNVTIIGDFAFSFCRHLQSITIPNSVISIGSWAFQGCPLFSITIGNGLEHIGGCAFSGCKFDSIIIPKSVKKINYGVFRYCERLAHIIVEDGNAIYDSRDNCNAIIKTAENTLVAGCKNTIIPYSVTSIGDDAFYDCSSLTSITIPNSVTSIGSRAFRGCSSLTSVTIGNSVESIGNEAFSNCSSLTSVTIPNSVTSIGISAFGYCYSLTSITIPNSVKKIEYWAFWFCYSLKSIIIPNSVESIGRAAFYDCRSLKSVTISENLKSIDFSTFAYCSELTTINIPNNVTSIGDYAFLGCSSLDSITIPKNVENIGDSVFLHCDSLEFVKLKTTTPPTLGVSIFSSQLDFYIPCGTLPSYEASDWNNYAVNFESYQLYTMDVSTNDKNMGDVTILENACERPIVISATPHFGYHFTQWSDGNTDNPRTIVLTHDTTLTAEFAPIISGLCGDSLYWKYDQINKTISITGSGNMYDYTIDTQPWILFKEEIKEVHISNMATSIGIAAFQGCTRLSKVNIGTAMKNIAANAFANCAKLYDIYCYAAEPPIAQESSFANYNAVLHVPCESQRLYMLDILFGEFKYIECIASDEVPTDDIVITPGSTDVTITWPTENNADTYTIVITKDGEVVCTLTFNSNGQLLNIAFAPGRQGNHPAQYAEATTNGYRFTVTGLEEATDYTYTITTKDASNKTISEHSGEFTTQSTTALDNTHSSSANTQKLLRDGLLLIIRDGVEYNAQGVRL